MHVPRLVVTKCATLRFYEGSSRYTFLFGTNGYGFKEPRVQMVRGYGFHIIAVENGRFWRNSVCCGPVYGCVWSSLRFGYGPVYDSRLSLRVGFGPICTQQCLSSRTATPNMPSTLGMPCFHRFVPTLLNFDIHRLPSSRLLCLLHVLDALAAPFLLRRNDGVVLLKLW